MRYTTDTAFLAALVAAHPFPPDDSDAKYVTRICDYAQPPARRSKVGLWQRIYQAAEGLAKLEIEDRVAEQIRGHVRDALSCYAQSGRGAEWWLHTFGARRRLHREGWDLPSVEALRNRMAAKWYAPEHPIGQLRDRLRAEAGHASTNDTA